MLVGIATVAIATSAAAQGIGTVAGVEGTVEVGRAGGWSPLVLGSSLEVGDQLRTAAGGRALVSLQDESVVAVGVSTQLAITKFARDTRQGTAKTAVRLVEGKVRVVVPVKDAPAGLEQFEVETTVGLARVKGTEFVIAFDPVGEVAEVVGVAGETAAHSVLDRVGRGVVVTARELTILRRGQFPTPPQRLTETLFRQYIEGLEFIGDGRAESFLPSLPLLRDGTLNADDRATAFAEPSPWALIQPGATIESRDIGTLTGQPPITRQPNFDLGPEIEALGDEPRDRASLLGEPPSVLESQGDLGIRF